jgi:hypothetical protein
MIDTRKKFNVSCKTTTFIVVGKITSHQFYSNFTARTRIPCGINGTKCTVSNVFELWKISQPDGRLLEGSSHVLEFLEEVCRWSVILKDGLDCDGVDGD